MMNWKNVEGSDCGPVLVSVSAFAWRQKKKKR
jgi:hypothetical protein